MNSGTSLPELPIHALAAEAWRARERARVLGATKVGCSVLGAGGKIWSGCNIEHRFRSHDIHAETNAIGCMVADGEQGLVALFVAAMRERFTPCGACLDWVFEFGSGVCVVATQSGKDSPIEMLTARELMPYYPR